LTVLPSATLPSPNDHVVVTREEMSDASTDMCVAVPASVIDGIEIPSSRGGDAS